MPFDLRRLAPLIRSSHGDGLRLREALLDLLFATEFSTRERAAAFPEGDGFSLRARPSDARSGAPVVLVAVDVEPPRRTRNDAGFDAWPPHLSSLGGPATALGWIAAIRALHATKSAKPWEAIYVRGPAFCIGSLVEAALEAERDATPILLVPAAEAPGGDRDFALGRLRLTRARNVWRFPACPHGLFVRGDAGPDLFGRFRTWLAALEKHGATTVHDLGFSGGREGHIEATVRAAASFTTEPPLESDRLPEDMHLRYPINDALAALSRLVARTPEPVASALANPLGVASRPDGLEILIAAAEAPEFLPTEAAAPMQAEWTFCHLAAHTDPVRQLAVDSADHLGPAPTAVLGGAARVAALPSLENDDDFAALERAYTSAMLEWLS